MAVCLLVLKGVDLVFSCRGDDGVCLKQICVARPLLPYAATKVVMNVLCMWLTSPPYLPRVELDTILTRYHIFFRSIYVIRISTHNGFPLFACLLVMNVPSGLLQRQPTLTLVDHKPTKLTHSLSEANRLLKHPTLPNTKLKQNTNKHREIMEENGNQSDLCPTPFHPKTTQIRAIHSSRRPKNEKSASNVPTPN